MRGPTAQDKAIALLAGELEERLNPMHPEPSPLGPRRGQGLTAQDQALALLAGVLEERLDGHLPGPTKEASVCAGDGCSRLHAATAET